MDLSHIPLFEAMVKRMAWLSERQTVLAENVANADTPGYVGHDLAPQDFSKLLSQTSKQVTLVTTQPGHIAVKQNLDDNPEVISTGDRALNGNGVKLEDQMMKVSETANNFALITTLYRANVNIIKSVLGRSS